MSNVDTITDIPDQDLISMRRRGYSKSKIFREVGIVGNDPRAWSALRDRFESLDLDHTNKRADYSQLSKIVPHCLCYSDVVKALGLSIHGGNISHVKKQIDGQGIDISHFCVSASMRRNKKNWTYENIFCENSEVSRPALRGHVLRHEVMEYKCIQCGNDGTWQGSELSLDIDHINGVNNDNRVENLRFLCPNCHRQTKTWGRSKR